MDKEKLQIKVQITPSAKDALERACQKLDMTQIGVISRLIAWFVAQDDAVQVQCLGMIPRETHIAFLTALLQAEVAKHPPATDKGMTQMAEVLKTIRELGDQIERDQRSGRPASSRRQAS